MARVMRGNAAHPSRMMVRRISRSAGPSMRLAGSVVMGCCLGPSFLFVATHLPLGNILHVEASQVFSQVVFSRKPLLALSVTVLLLAAEVGHLVLGFVMSHDVSLAAEEFLGISIFVQTRFVGAKVLVLRGGSIFLLDGALS